MTERRNSTLFVHKSLGTTGDGGGNANADVVRRTNCSVALGFRLGLVGAEDVFVSSYSPPVSLASKDIKAQITNKLNENHVIRLSQKFLSKYMLFSCFSHLNSPIYR